MAEQFSDMVDGASGSIRSSIVERVACPVCRQDMSVCHGFHKYDAREQIREALFERAVVAARNGLIIAYGADNATEVAAALVAAEVIKAIAEFQDRAERDLPTGNDGGRG